MGFSVAVGLGKVLGFVRSIIIAAFLGAAQALDGFYAFNVLIGLLVIVLSEQVEVFISCEGSRLLAAERNGDFTKFSQRLLTLSILLGLFFGLLPFITLPLLGPLLLPPGAVATLTGSPAVAWYLLPLTVLTIPLRAACALLKCADRLRTAVLSDLFQSLLLCLFTYAALKSRQSAEIVSRVEALSVAQSAAVTFTFLGTLYCWRRLRGARLFAKPDAETVRALLSSLGHLSLISYLFYAFTIIDRRYAGIARDGGIALLTYASSLSFTMRSVINFEQIHILDFATQQDKPSVYRNALWQCAAISIPVGVFVSYFPTEIVRAVYERGSFSAEMSELTGEILRVYGMATTIFLLWALCLRVLQVERLLTAIIPLVVLLIPLDILICEVAVPRLGLAGAITGTLLVHIILLFAVDRLLRRKGVALFTVPWIYQVAGLLLLSLIWGVLVAWLPLDLDPTLALCIRAILYFPVTYVPVIILRRYRAAGRALESEQR